MSVSQVATWGVFGCSCGLFASGAWAAIGRLPARVDLRDEAGYRTWGSGAAVAGLGFICLAINTVLFPGVLWIFAGASLAIIGLVLQFRGRRRMRDRSSMEGPSVVPGRLPSARGRPPGRRDRR